MKFLNVHILILCSLLCMAVSAAEGMKPGLWEHSFTLKSQSGKIEKVMADLKKQMATMPVGQREIIEEMMAKQGVGIAPGKTSSVMVCISKEQAENLEFPNGQSDKCSNEVLKKTESSVSLKFTCEGNPKSEGTADFMLAESKAYIGKASMIMTTADSKTNQMEMNSKGKWLSSDCKNIKSVQSKK